MDASPEEKEVGSAESECETGEEDQVEEPPMSDASSSEEVVDENEEDEAEDVNGEEGPADDQEREPLDVELHPVQDPVDQETTSQTSESTPSPLPASTPETTQSAPPIDPPPVYDDPSDSDDGEGDWITPSNVALHKSRALELLPSAADSGGRRGKGKARQETIMVGCMTADFAMQNVLLQMGLGLVGVEGKRIERVKSWVLRCHACFKCVFISYVAEAMLTVISGV